MVAKVIADRGVQLVYPAERAGTALKSFVEGKSARLGALPKQSPATQCYQYRETKALCHIPITPNPDRRTIPACLDAPKRTLAALALEIALAPLFMCALRFALNQQLFKVDVSRLDGSFGVFQRANDADESANRHFEKFPFFSHPI
jgi:hypothetical protein